MKNYCSGQKEYYQQRAQTDQAFLGGVGWYLELTDPNISPKIQESPGGYVSASFIPANLSENDVRNAPDFSVLYIHRPATLLFRSEKFINLQISCNDQGRSPRTWHIAMSGYYYSMIDNNFFWPMTCVRNMKVTKFPLFLWLFHDRLIISKTAGNSPHLKVVRESGSSNASFSEVTINCL